MQVFYTTQQFGEDLSNKHNNESQTTPPCRVIHFSKMFRLISLCTRFTALLFALLPFRCFSIRPQVTFEVVSLGSVDLGSLIPSLTKKEKNIVVDEREEISKHRGLCSSLEGPFCRFINGIDSPTFQRDNSAGSTGREMHPGQNVLKNLPYHFDLGSMYGLKNKKSAEKKIAGSFNIVGKYEEASTSFTPVLRVPPKYAQNSIFFSFNMSR